MWPEGGGGGRDRGVGKEKGKGRTEGTPELETEKEEREEEETKEGKKEEEEKEEGSNEVVFGPQPKALRVGDKVKLYPGRLCLQVVGAIILNPELYWYILPACARLTPGGNCIPRRLLAGRAPLISRSDRGGA